MNIKEYISSGNIELYVLGLLPGAERDELQSLAAQHVEINQAIAQAEDQMLQLDNALGIDPPQKIKHELFDSLTAAQETKVFALPAKTESVPLWPKLLVAASIALALVSGYLAFDYHQKWQESEGNYIGLQEQNQVLADNVQRTNNELAEKAAYLTTITGEGMQEVILGGLPYQPAALAKVYFNAQSQEVLLHIASLTDLDDSSDYQLWAIIDGKPVDIGVVDVKSASLVQRMTSAAGASAFAITIEPKGGSTFPTLDKMVVYGAVSS